MNGFKKLSLFKFLILFGFMSCLDLPSDFKKCKRDNKFEKCVKEALQDALPKLANGLSDFKLPSIDPLYVPSLVIGEGVSGAVKVVQNFKDVNFHGISTAKIESVKATANDKELSFDLDLIVETIQLKGNYNFNGQVLVLPIVGEGKCDIKLLKVKINLVLTCHPFEKDGKTYMGVEDVKMKLTPEKVEFQLDNLFNGDKQLGDQILTVLNDNWKEVFEDIKSGYEEAFAVIFKNIASQIFKNIPYNTIMPV